MGNCSLTFLPYGLCCGSMYSRKLSPSCTFYQAGLKETLSGFERDMIILSKEQESHVLTELSLLAEKLQVRSCVYLLFTQAAFMSSVPSS